MTLYTSVLRLFHVTFARLVPLALFLGISFVMLRRFSTFRKGKKDESRVNGTSGKVNGTTEHHSSPPPQKKATEDVHPSAGRAEVESTFEQFGQLIHAARRPLPTQSGDGAYLDHEVPSGLMQDLKSLGFRDVKTLMELMKTKATGGLQDDKTMIMERVIQVTSPFYLYPLTSALTRSSACQWATQAVESSCRLDQYLYRRVMGFFGAPASKLSRKQVPVSSG